MSLDRKLLLKAIYDEMQRAIEARVGRFLIGDRLNLAAPTVGVLPASAGGTETTAGVTIRGAGDYDNSNAPATGQVIVWNGSKFHAAAVPDATPTSKGVVQLAGDLAGTAASPALAASGVTAGTYTDATVTVDAKGRITSASSGTGGVPYGPLMDGPSASLLVTSAGDCIVAPD